MKTKNEILAEIKFTLIKKHNINALDDALINDCVEMTLKAINYSHCCKSDSELLPSKEEMNNRLYALANELKTNDKQTEKIYFESGFRYCQQVIKEHLTK